MCNGIHPAPFGTLTTEQHPPQTCISPHFSMEISGPQYAAQKSPQHFVPQPQSSNQRWDPHHKMSACTRCGPAALLVVRIDTDTIRLVGSCRSNTMLRYLHTIEQTFTEGIEARMV